MLLRLVSLITFGLISYGAGFSTVRYRNYISVTMLGIIPGVLIYANTGANALKINSCGFYLSVALLAGLIAIFLLLKKRLWRKLDM